jgi:hypothetical protein
LRFESSRFTRPEYTGLVLLSHNPEQSKQNGGYIQFAAVGGNAKQAHVKEIYPATFGFCVRDSV